MIDNHSKNCDTSLDECIIWEVLCTVAKHCFLVNSLLRCGKGNYCFFNKTNPKSACVSSFDRHAKSKVKTDTPARGRG